MSLNVEVLLRETRIRFRFFNEEFFLSLKQMSLALGFHKCCILDANTLVKDHRYNRNTWWDTISNDPICSKNSITSIHNPTL